METGASISAVLWEGPAEELTALQSRLAAQPGPIIPIFPRRFDTVGGSAVFPVEWLVHERATSINTAAAGGNASLMAVA
jgi:RHH-type proline utilization regulon transcriptional repressor/proline dehydrogenase/delta 1-pyrroline-5-carboxylate dehydrogenase